MIERIKDVSFDVACFGHLALLVFQVLLGARMLILPVLLLAQDSTSPAAAQQASQISGLRSDLSRHERKIDELREAVHELGIDMAKLSGKIGDAENSHSSDDWSDKAVMAGLLILLGERGWGKFSRNHKKKP